MLIRNMLISLWPDSYSTTVRDICAFTTTAKHKGLKRRHTEPRNCNGFLNFLVKCGSIVSNLYFLLLLMFFFCFVFFFFFIP